MKLLGDLFALPNNTISEIFRPLFSEFLKRLTDRVVEVRISVIEDVKKCLLSNPSRSEAPEIISKKSLHISFIFIIFNLGKDNPFCMHPMTLSCADVFFPDALSDRLLDYDENVRKQVVAAVFDIACQSQTLKSVPADIVRLAAERLRDKSVLHSFLLSYLVMLYGRSTL